MLDFGFTGQLAIPECGCDECDESIEECRARLEEVTAAVVGGRLTEERIRRVARPDRSGWRLEFEHGSQSRVGLEILTERASRVAIPPGETRWPPWLPR